MALPDIDIAVGNNPHLFIMRMVSLAESKTEMTVELHQDAFGKDGLHFANFFLLVVSENLRSGGQLIVRPDEARVQVEMRSATWESGHPTRDKYIAFCKEVFGPLLHDYNRVFGTHHRMRIARPRSGYQLPPHSKRLFERFSILANKRSLHPLDWERFYLFVRNSRREIPEGTLRSLLVQKGLPAETAQMLSDLYHHLWRFKRLKF